MLFVCVDDCLANLQSRNADSEAAPPLCCTDLWNAETPSKETGNETDASDTAYRPQCDRRAAPSHLNTST
jgi:hypothetical protein